MHNKRTYTRYRLDDREVNGRMVLATEVKIIDVSITGISLKANRRLSIGSDYTLKLEGNRAISLRGTVVWCSLIEAKKGAHGDMMPIYSAGIKLKDMSTERITELINFIEDYKIEKVHVIGGTRLNVRFHIKDPENAVLIYPDDYRVKTISLRGMLIECLRCFEVEDRIPMEMFIHDDNPLKFVGRVASCDAMENDGQKYYNLGIEFLDLTKKDHEVLAAFIEEIEMADTES